jgi:chlorophyll synthase
MAAPQVVVVLLLVHWGFPIHALAVSGLLAAQLALMAVFLRAPREKAPWYNATGTSLYVIGMLVTAFALRGMHP